jgi:hypothetical protein
MSREKTILDLEHAAANLEDMRLYELAVPIRRAALYLRNVDRECQTSVGDINRDDPAAPCDREAKDRLRESRHPFG